MGISYNTSLVRDGLVLHLDAANKKSYTGTGTAWNDMTVNGNNATLVNGVAYNAANNGSMVFDGVNDYVNGGNLGSFFTQGTISYWMNSSVVENYRNPFSTKYLGLNEGIRFEQTNSGTFAAIIGNTSNQYTINYYTLDTVITANTWYNVVLVWNTSTNNIVGHLNGIQKFNSTHTYWATTLPSISIGSGFDSGRFFAGKISNTLIYNRALTTLEIQKNFNTLRGRYGV
jgi:hypothetical protein